MTVQLGELDSDQVQLISSSANRRQSTRTSTSPPPPDYDIAVNGQNDVALQIEEDDDELLTEDDFLSDVNAMGIQCLDDDVCLLGEDIYGDDQRRPSQNGNRLFRNRLPSFEAYPTEKPPRFTKQNHTFDAFTTCKVCLEVFKVTGRLNQSVVKCPHCNEATPIKDPPFGKKFVRCPCNCLLVAKSSAMRIACPRAECKKIINLHANRVPPGGETSERTTGHRVICGHCAEGFVVDILRESHYARCPQCRGESSIGPNYKRKKIFIYLVLCIVFITLSMLSFIVFYEFAKTHQIIYVFGTLFALCLFVCVYKLIVFCRWKVSNIVEANIPDAVAIPENSHIFSSNHLRRFSSFRRSLTSSSSFNRGGGDHNRSRDRSNSNTRRRPSTSSTSTNSHHNRRSGRRSSSSSSTRNHRRSSRSDLQRTVTTTTTSTVNGTRTTEVNIQLTEVSSASRV